MRNPRKGSLRHPRPSVQTALGSNAATAAAGTSRHRRFQVEQREHLAAQHAKWREHWVPMLPWRTHPIRNWPYLGSGYAAPAPRQPASYSKTSSR